MMARRGPMETKKPTTHVFLLRFSVRAPFFTIRQPTGSRSTQMEEEEEEEDFPV